MILDRHITRPCNCARWTVVVTLPLASCLYWGGVRCKIFQLGKKSILFTNWGKKIHTFYQLGEKNSYFLPIGEKISILFSLGEKYLYFLPIGEKICILLPIGGKICILYQLGKKYAFSPFFYSLLIMLFLPPKKKNIHPCWNWVLNGSWKL